MAEEDVADMSQSEAAEDEDMEDAADSSPQEGAQWVPPRAFFASDMYGFLGFFADLEQGTKPPQEHLQQLMAGHDGSVLVKASPMTIAQPLEGGMLHQLMQCIIHLSLISIESFLCWKSYVGP